MGREIRIKTVPRRVSFYMARTKISSDNTAWEIILAFTRYGTFYTALFFFVIPFYLQSVSGHSANCDKLTPWHVEGRSLALLRRPTLTSAKEII
jgi:hypothetical protein